MACKIRLPERCVVGFVLGVLAPSCTDESRKEPSGEPASETCEAISERLGKRHYDLASYDGDVEGLCAVKDAFVCGLDAGAAITVACAPGGGCCSFTSTDTPWRCGWKGCDETPECKAPVPDDGVAPVAEDEAPYCAEICVTDSECQPTEACTHRIGNLMFCAPKGGASDAGEPSETCETISERLGKRHYDLASYDGDVEGLCAVKDAFVCGLDAGPAFTVACAPSGGCCAFTSTDTPWRCGWEGCDGRPECMYGSDGGAPDCTRICVTDAECQPTEACTQRIGNLMFCSPKGGSSDAATR